jgi:hypothetical protein
MPDYDTRGRAPDPPEESILWVPRMVLAPLYITSEYIVRRPLGYLITTAETQGWPSAIIEFFTFDKEHTVGVVPTAFFDFGFHPTAGVYFFWDKAIWDNNSFRFSASAGGRSWTSIKVSDRVKLAPGALLSVEGSWIRRPDWVFHGIGANTLESDRSRYAADTVDVGPKLFWEVVPEFRIKANVGFKSSALSDGNYGHDPSVLDSVVNGTFPLPTAFGTRYTAIHDRLEAAFDTRDRRPASQSGLRISAFGEHGSVVGTTPAYAWIKYGGTIGGFWDFLRRERVVSLVLTAEFADPIKENAIPFPEQVVFGGLGALAGFRPGRLVGRSGAAAVLSYEWPIWVWLDGTMHFAVGNVFDEHLKDFDPKLLRFSSSIGMRTNSGPDHQLEVLLGMGTETFAHGGDITSFRFVIGGTNGF